MKALAQLIAVILLTLVFLNPALAQKQISKRELIALLELRARTKGDEWNKVWDLSTPITEWHGLTLKNGKVVYLDLGENNLQGNLPLTIGNLTYLERLDLSNNSLRGKMPRELRKFKNLKHLDLSGNQFVGHLPVTLNRMPQLVYLDLGRNHFEGPLPQSLVELANLNILSLANNNFFGQMPKGMENLKNLKKLYISNNNFSSLENLRILAKQQPVITDIDVRSNNFNAIDQENYKKGVTELKFDDGEH